MKHWNRRRLAGLSFVVALVACVDGAERIAAPPSASTQAHADGADGSALAERETLSNIGRLISISLADRQLRHRLKKDLRAAPFKEHKLELRRYLRSADGRQLLRSMASAGGRSPDAILTRVEQIRSLELYMPVRRHRENWVGDGELLVATQLEDEDPIVGFNGRGQEVQLNASTEPTQPTLSLVPSETRFDQPMPMGSRNVDDKNGQSIGTLMLPDFKVSNVIACAVAMEASSERLAPLASCGGGGGGSGSPPPTIPPGMYLEFSRILDLHEPWTRGAPEIEVHIQGPSDQGNPRLGDDLSCSGEHAYDYRKVFDQNSGFWEGRVMLFSADEVTRFNSKFNDGFHVLFWEDDDTSCLLKLDNESLLEFLKSTAVSSAVAIKALPLQWRLLATLFLATMFTNPGEWLKTNDDFVGVAVPQETTGYSYPTNTHVIMKGTTLNGRATLVYR
jgi:hypothetical protein